MNAQVQTGASLFITLEGKTQEQKEAFIQNVQERATRLGFSSTSDYLVHLVLKDARCNLLDGPSYRSVADMFFKVTEQDLRRSLITGKQYTFTEMYECIRVGSMKHLPPASKLSAGVKRTLARYARQNQDVSKHIDFQVLNRHNIGGLWSLKDVSE